MTKYLLTPLLILSLSFNHTALAKTYQFLTIYSPGCNPIKLKRMGKTGIQSIAARLTRAGKLSGYVITLDTSKLNYQQLLKKMQMHYCFASNNWKVNQFFNRTYHRITAKSLPVP